MTMPDDLIGYFNRGNAFFKAQRFADALEQYDLALRLRPGHPRVLLNRGQALRNLGRFDEAIAALRAASAGEPDNADTLRALAQLLFAARRPEEAADGAASALTLAPTDSALHVLHGLALRMARRPADAIAAFQAAEALDPTVRRRSDAGACRLMLGEFADGWRDFDQRGHSPEAAHLAARMAPKWLGQDPVGKTILVHAEQGLGDTIHFGRYLPLMAERGARVLFAPQPALKRLFKSLAWPAPPARPLSLVDLGDPGLAFDYQVRTMSLPLAFQTRLETIPARTPYLAVEPSLAAKWRAAVGDQGFRIGVAWDGSADARRAGRTFDPRLLAPFADMPGVRLISLQKDDPTHSAADLAMLGIETLPGELDAGGEAFVDTAAVIGACDLVITLDSAIAHLSGALARPTWIALSRHGEWRWLMERTSSPWYPSTRLWRQSQLDDWPPVFAAMKAELERQRSKPTQSG
jgi:tetratricopeptide (TPR) repeat protein